MRDGSHTRVTYGERRHASLAQGRDELGRVPQSGSTLKITMLVSI